MISYLTHYTQLATIVLMTCSQCHYAECIATWLLHHDLINSMHSLNVPKMFLGHYSDRPLSCGLTSGLSMLCHYSQKTFTAVAMFVDLYCRSTRPYFKGRFAKDLKNCKVPLNILPYMVYTAITLLAI